FLCTASPPSERYPLSLHDALPISISVELGRGGATVVVNYAGNEAAARETCALVEAAGGKAEARRFDVADAAACQAVIEETIQAQDRKSTRLNSSHVKISYAVFCLK